MTPLTTLVCRLRPVCVLQSILSRNLYTLSTSNRLGFQKYGSAVSMGSCFDFGRMAHRMRVCTTPHRISCGWQGIRESSSSTQIPETVFVIKSDGETVQMTLKKAQIMAAKQKMKLFRRKKGKDSKIDTYSMLSELQFKEEKQKAIEETAAQDRYKKFTIGVKIEERDLSYKLAQVKKHLLKGTPVRLMFTSSAHGSGSTGSLANEKLKASADLVMASCIKEFKDIATVTLMNKGNYTYVIQFKVNDNILNPA